MKHIQIFKSKNRKVFTSLLVLLLATCSLIQAQAQIYLLNTNETYKFLQLENNSQNNGTRVVLGDRRVNPLQKEAQSLWIHDYATHTIRLAANPNKCMHRAGQYTDGDPIQLYDYIPGGHPNQEWVFEDGRILLMADKSYCIDAIHPYSTPNYASLRPLNLTGSNAGKFYGRDKSNFALTADGQWHRIESPGETYLEVAIPNPCPSPYLTIRAHGGDGGYRSVLDLISKKEVVKARGGKGATVTATFKIGTGANELQPGTTIRLVIGRAGYSWVKEANTAAGGGGGGTGVIYEVPATGPNADRYFPWKMLLVAGGGGGGYTDIFSKDFDGYPGNSAKEAKDGDDWTDSNGFNVGISNTDLLDNGSGYRDEFDPALVVSHHQQKNDAGGFKSINGLLFPVGQKRSQANSSYGFGGGGPPTVGITAKCGNGGGGYNGSRGSGGGGSYVDWSMTMPGTGYMVMNDRTTSSKDGYVEYQFSGTAPASRSYFEYGAQDIEILKSGAYTLKWQSDGNLVLYGPPGAIWTTGTNGRGKDLAFQGDGNLAIYENGSVIWSTDTGNGNHGGKGGKTLTLNEEGMLSIADVDNKTIWRPTGPKALRYNSFEYGLQDVELLKCGTYTLKWQGDGNLVLYGPSGAVWASYTNGRCNRISFQPDGNLVIYNNSTAVWTSDTADNQHGGNGGRLLLLTADGWLAILDKYWQKVGGWGYDAEP